VTGADSGDGGAMMVEITHLWMQGSEADAWWWTVITERRKLLLHWRRLKCRIFELGNELEILALKVLG
jgi:hypothetical protein